MLTPREGMRVQQQYIEACIPINKIRERIYALHMPSYILKKDGTMQTCSTLTETEKATLALCDEMERSVAHQFANHFLFQNTPKA